MDENEFEQKRKQLVESLRTEGYSKPVLDAFLKVKRECFVPERFHAHAYANDVLPIGHNQTISQPSTVAQMLELLELQAGMTVLEVGSGSGYALALLKEMTGKNGNVFGIDLENELVTQAKKNLECNESGGIELNTGDGSLGWKQKSPFDRVLMSAATPLIPKPLFDQLKENGLIVAPVGDAGFQKLTILKKIGGKPFKKEFEEGFFVFVPLRGAYIQQIRNKIES